MIQGTTKSGFAYEIDESLADDFRLVEAIADADSDDASDKLRGTVNLVRLLLGEKGKKALYKHLQETRGSVPTEAVIEAATEIMQAAREKSAALKN